MNTGCVVCSDRRETRCRSYLAIGIFSSCLSSGQKLTTAIFCFCLALAIAGCGGGGSSSGGGGGGPTNTGPSPAALADERDNTLTLSLLKAPQAYSRGYTGAGVTIGSYEVAIATDPELTGKLDDNKYAVGDSARIKDEKIDEDDWADHARSTALAAVARRDGSGIHGIAYDANLMFVSAWNAEILDNENFDTGKSRFAQAINFLNDKVPVAYVAFRVSTYKDIPDTSKQTSDLETDLTKDGILPALRQSGTDAANRTIWIFAAGNESTSDPVGKAYMGVRWPDLNSHFLTVVAVNSVGTILDDSARCGAAKDYCIAVPSSAYEIPGSGGVYESGTSVGAAIASAAFAIMKQAFPDLGNDELVTRVKTTANKSGIYETESIYGQGLINLDAATKPVGPGSIPGRDSVVGSSFPVAVSSIRPPGYFGDSLARGFSGHHLMILDELGAPFYSSLDSFVLEPSRQNQAGQFLKKLLGRGMTHVRQEPPDGHAYWVGLQPTPLGTDSLRTFGSETAFGLAAATPFRLPGKAGLQLSPGLILEQESTLGMKTSGAFGDTDSRTVYLDINADQRYRGWDLSATATLGITDPDNSGTLVRYSSPLVSTGFNIKASRQMADFDMEFSLSQPLRVESGKVSLRYPSARTPDRRVLYSALTADLKPSGREVTASALVRVRHANNLSSGFGIYTTRHPGHIRSAGTDLGVAAALSLAF